MHDSYDVIIVGGRPAGASLAARLGEQGLKVLILERATFPSAPAVSSPWIVASALDLLDEIGADEAQYARGTPQLRHIVLQFRDYFKTTIPILPHGKRDYMLAIDRERFDAHLWQNLARFPSVTAREGMSVTDLTRAEDGAVTGVRASDGSDDYEFAADLVVGADGRFSTVAAKADAGERERRSDVDTSLYYAYWEGVAPYDDSGTMAQIYTSGDGYSFVFMPSADGRTSVFAQGQAELIPSRAGDTEGCYLELLRAHPPVWRRLRNARRVTPISGMKRMGNLYRHAGGPGWALVGDALHQKDSIDAQGIYDALLGAKLLAGEIAAWRSGERTWAEAAARYEEAFWEATHPMFEATLDRVKREIYDSPPPPVAKSILRWVLTDPTYLTRFVQLLNRELDPATWAGPPVMAGAVARGIGRDLSRALRRAPNPAAVPSNEAWEREIAAWGSDEGPSVAPELAEARD